MTGWDYLWRLTEFGRVRSVVTVVLLLGSIWLITQQLTDIKAWDWGVLLWKVTTTLVACGVWLFVGLVVDCVVPFGGRGRRH